MLTRMKLTAQLLYVLIKKCSLGGCLKVLRTTLGSININQFVFTSRANAIITVFPGCCSRKQTSCYHTMYYLATNSVSVPILCQQPAPISFHHKNNPVAVATRLLGTIPSGAGQEHTEVGRGLGMIHLVGTRSRYYSKHLYGMEWIIRKCHEIIESVPTKRRSLLEFNFSFCLSTVLLQKHRQLMAATCHCDLFTDNTIFKTTSHLINSRMTGCLDFYFSGHESLLFDVGVMINAWCLAPQKPCPKRSVEFLHSYQLVRPLTKRERRGIKGMVRLSAFRFWLLRAHGFYKLKASAPASHDPSKLEVVLESR